MLLSKYRNNDSGASATEFALAVPLIVVLFYGMAQFGLILLANAGLRHAIDTAQQSIIGATPMTDAQIQTIVSSSLYGMTNGTVSTPAVIRGTSNGVSYVDISISYAVPIDLIFYQYGPIILQERRRAYLP
jgi:Flp pilus assembly protein TadG